MNEGIQRNLLCSMKYHGCNVIIKKIKDITKDSDTWCTFKHQGNEAVLCYRSFGGITALSYILEKFYLIFVYLEVSPTVSKDLKHTIDSITSPEKNSDVEAFNKHISQFLKFFKFHEDILSKKVNLLTYEESIRLDEAIDCFENYCFYSTVVMAVSAVESRLHYIIKQKDKSLYERSKFEKATLGKLIRIFDKSNTDPNFNSIRKIIPTDHKPLMDLLNIYRLYSAHPKAQLIDPNIAKSILTLSFVFLLDERLKVKQTHSKRRKKTSK